jgi:tRNA G37 N-methylase Trm5
MEQLNLFTRERIKESPCVGEEFKGGKDQVKIVDLFAGIGGFHFGIAASAVATPVV